MDSAHADDRLLNTGSPDEDNGVMENEVEQEAAESSVPSPDASLDEWLEETGKLAAVSRGEPLDGPITSSQAVKEAIASDPCPLPQVLLDLTKITNEDSLSWSTLGKIIERDPEVSRQVLVVVNGSRHFIVPTRVTSVSHAASFLTTPRLIDLALLVCVYQVCDRPPFNQIPLLDPLDLVKHLALTSSAARLIIGELGPGKVRAFEGAVAGMLHDIGILVLGRTMPRTYAAILERQAKKKRKSLLSMEREVLGCDHLGIGAQFVSTLNLPPRIVEAVARHHGPLGDSARRILAGVVALANRACNHRGVSVIPDMPQEPMDPSIRQFVWGVKPDWARADVVAAMFMRCGERINVRLTEIKEILSILSDRSDFVMEKPADFQMPPEEETAEESALRPVAEPVIEPEPEPEAAPEFPEEPGFLPHIKTIPVRESRPRGKVDWTKYLLPGFHSIQRKDRVEGSLVFAIFAFSLVGLLLYEIGHSATKVFLLLGLLGSIVWNIIILTRD